MRKKLRLMTVIMICVITFTSMQPALQPAEASPADEAGGRFDLRNLQRSPSTVKDGEAVTLYCDVYKERSVYDLYIRFWWKRTTESDWHYLTTYIGKVVGPWSGMDLLGTYSKNIGSFSTGTVVQYYVEGWGYTYDWGTFTTLRDTTPWGSFTVYEANPPVITSLKVLPYYPTGTSGTTISAVVTDDTALSSVFLDCLFDNSIGATIAMTSLPGNVYSAYIPQGHFSTNMWYRIVATDQYGNFAREPASGHTLYTSSETHPDTGWYSYVHENRATAGPLHRFVNYFSGFPITNPPFYVPSFNWNADFSSLYGVYHEFSSSSPFRVASNTYGLIKRVPISSSLTSSGAAQLRLDIDLNYYPTASAPEYEKWKIHIVDEIVASGSPYIFNPLASTGDITGTKNVWNNGIFSLSFATSSVTGNDVYVMLEMDEVLGSIGLRAAINTLKPIAIETTPPDVQITSPSNGQIIKHVTGGTDVPYTYTVTDVNTYTVTVKLDGQAVVKDGMLDNLDPGSHTLRIEALDAAGNLGFNQIQFWVAPEAITNGGFESGLTNWIGTGKLSPDEGYTGPHSCSLLTSTPVYIWIIILDHYDYSYHQITQVFDTNTVVITDNVLSFSFWGKHSDTSIIATVRFSDGTQTERYFGGSSSYQKHFITGLPAGKRITEVKLRGNGPPEGLNYRTSYIDDISLFYLPYDDNTDPVVQITSPSNGQVFTYTPGGTGVPYAYSVTELNNYDVKVKLNGQLENDDGLLENLATGTYTLRVEALDAAGNLGYRQIQFSVVDESPVITVSPPNYLELLQGSSHILSWTATDLYPDVCTITRDGNPVLWGISWTSGVPVEVPVDTSQLGTYIYEIEFLDTSGNPATDQVTVKIIDTTPPAVSNPPDFTRELGQPVTVQWTVTDTNPGVYSLTVNGIRLITDKPWTNGLITETVPNQVLIRGPNTITAVFRDSSGNSNSDTVIVTIVDTTVPRITIPQSDMTLDSGTAFVLSWTAEDLDPDVYEVYREGPGGERIRIQSGPWQSGVAITVFEDVIPPGDYLYQIYISDGTGNTVIDTVEVTIIDRTPPAVVIEYPGDGDLFEYEAGGTNVAYGYSVTDASEYTVKIFLNGVEKPDTGSLPSLLIGNYKLEVNVTDIYGNIGSTTINFRVQDTRLPEIVDSPADTITINMGETTVLSWTAEDLLPGIYVVYRGSEKIQEDYWTSGDPVTVYIDSLAIGVGTHAYRIEFKDTSGNALSDEVSVIVLNVPPVIVDSPADIIIELGETTTLSWTAEDHDPDIYKVYHGSEKIQGDYWTSGDPVTVYIDSLAIGVGTHAYRIEFIDSYGIVEFDDVVVMVVDTTAPVVQITSPSEGDSFELLIGGIDVSYTYVVEDLSSYEVIVKLNGDIVTDGGTLSGLGVGNYLLEVNATDIYGNSDSVTVQFTVVDTTAPSVTITDPIAGETFEYTAGGITIQYGYSVTDASDYTVDVYLNWTKMLDTGYFEDLLVANYFLEVNATDIYGNTAIAVIPFYVRDTVPPSVVIDYPLEGEIFMYVSGGTTVNYEYSIYDESGYMVTVYLNSIKMPDTGSLPNLVIGDYELEMIAVDVHGNTGSASVLFLVRDLFPPVTTLDTGEPNYLSDLLYVTDETPFTLEATDDSSGVQVTLYRVFNETHASDWLTYTGPFYLLSLADGNYTIEYYSIDNAGNTEEIQQASVTLFSWDHVFEQVCTENIILKIDTDNRFFQFISPDKDYGIREATYMKILKKVIIIKHEDSELELMSVAIDTRKNFCLVFATDLITGERYRLVGIGYGSDGGWCGHSWYCHKHHNHHHHKIHMHRHHHCHH